MRLCHGCGVLLLARQGVYRIAFKEPGMLEPAFSLRYEQVYIDDQTGDLRAL